MTDLPSKGPEGSWIITVKYDDPTVAPFHALITYSAGGGLVESDQGNPPGHGAWVIPTRLPCGKIEETPMWKGMKITNGTSNHTSSLTSVC